ncbi:MAG: hypothetical protein COB85_03220 [Bacteroidetes bacterium]|nr:MAG: hypothetical protein COB85_03220 [Bacteroidota bacterium]
MKKYWLAILLVSCFVLLLSVEGESQDSKSPVETSDYVEVNKSRENKVADRIVDTGWLIAVLGVITNIVGWGIQASDGEGVVVVGIGFGMVGAGAMTLGTGETARMVSRWKLSRDEVKDEMKEYAYRLDINLCKLASDVDYISYYDRIMNFASDSNYRGIDLRKGLYHSGQIKFIGLKSRHNFGKNPNYQYKIGTWRYFYPNGQLKRRVDYDLRENKHGLYETYYSGGEIKIRDEYRYSKKINE